MSSDFKNRKQIRLNDFDYSQNGSYFVTICTQGRQCLFGDVIATDVVGAVRERPDNLSNPIKLIHNDIGKIVDQCWNWLSEQYPYVELGPHVVMPNHFHGIVGIDNDNMGLGRSRTTPTKTLGRLVGAFKMVSTKHINIFCATPGKIIWQRGYYEHIIRNEDEYGRICEYIHFNPENWQEDEENPDR